MLPKFLIQTIATIALVTFVKLTTLLAEPPAASSTYGQPLATTSQAVADQAEPNEPSQAAQQDPLYLAIRKQLKAGREPLVPTANQTVIQSPRVASDDLSAAEWQAVEWMLRAARILEREEQRRMTDAPLDQTSIRKSMVKQLRLNAMQMVGSAIGP